MNAIAAGVIRLTSSNLARFVVAVTALLGGPSVLAADRAIEDIRIATRGGVATATIEFVCPVTYLSHSPSIGPEVRVRVALGPECVEELGPGLRSELHSPPRDSSADVNDVVFDTIDGQVGTVAISLGRVIRFSASQGDSRNMIRVIFDRNITESRSQLPSVEPPSSAVRPSTVVRTPVQRTPLQQTPAQQTPSAPSPASTPAATAIAQSNVDDSGTPAVSAAGPPIAAATSAPLPEEPPREPLRLVERTSPRGDLYVIQLAVDSELDESLGALAFSEHPDELLYFNERSAGEQRWQELRLGFFATELEARERLSTFSAVFPEAVISVADLAEQDRAKADPLAKESLLSMVSAAELPAADPAPGDSPPADSLDELTALPDARVDALLVEANEAMLNENYDRSIQIYSRLLEDQGFAERAMARERLGILRQRKGQTAQAKLEYESYLSEFPTGPDANRVRQRLAGLVATANPPRERLVVSADPESSWKFWGGVSQYVRRDVIKPNDAVRGSTTHSNLLSNVDFSAQRRGERFQIQSRFNGAYHYNLLDAVESRAPRDQLHVSNAYVTVNDDQRDWSARVGRQSLHKAGVLGRFDGAHFNYRWRPDIGLNFTLGRPVDFPRQSTDTQREIIGVSADLDQLVGQWDFSFFTIMQKSDGIIDREAAGGEARYRNEDWNIVTALDFDLGYSVINSALVNFNWRATDKLTVNGRFNTGTAPFLTTRNALIGQPVARISDLLGTYTEPQLRTLARDRTADAQDASLGISMPVFDRFQWNVDFSQSSFDSTVASGGVAAIPATGTQTFFNTSLVGSSIIKRGDTTVFSLRRSTTRSAVTDTFIFDVRLPVSERLRLSPRLALSTRTFKNSSEEETVLAPTLRLAYRWPAGHRVEAELGSRMETREFLEFVPGPFGVPVDSTETFLNLGYWWEFRP